MGNNKTTKCKVCGTEIAKSAKVCPQCGAKIKHPALGIIILIIGLILIIAGIAGAAGGNDDPHKVGEDTSKHETETQKTKFNVGEKVELKNVVVTLKGVTESEGSMFNEPSDGNVYVLCEFEIENNSSEEINVSSLLSFEGYCDDYAMQLSITALLEKGEKNQLDGTVAPGKKMNGVIGYEVPTDWKELEIKFTPDFWSNKSITFIANH